MTWFDWFLVAWWTLSIFVTIATTGKPRKPLEPTAVAISTAIALGLIVGLLLTRGVL